MASVPITPYSSDQRLEYGGVGPTPGVYHSPIDARTLVGVGFAARDTFLALHPRKAVAGDLHLGTVGVKPGYPQGYATDADALDNGSDNRIDADRTPRVPHDPDQSFVAPPTTGVSDQRAVVIAVGPGDSATRLNEPIDQRILLATTARSVAADFAQTHPMYRGVFGLGPSAVIGSYGVAYKDIDNTKRDIP